MKPLIIEIPVECQNGHKAMAYIEIDGLDAKFKSVPDKMKCACPKWGLGQGYHATGEPRVYDAELE